MHYIAIFIRLCPVPTWDESVLCSYEDECAADPHHVAHPPHLHTSSTTAILHFCLCARVQIVCYGEDFTVKCAYSWQLCLIQLFFLSIGQSIFIKTILSMWQCVSDA